MLIFMIIVLGIIVACMSAVESNKKQTKLSAIREKDRQMTNARLEQATVDKYMKHGFTFDEAFEMARDDMVAAGYTPCIPKSAYKVSRYQENSSTHYSSNCYHKLFPNVEGYDSFEVQQRRSSIKQQWRNVHGEEEIPSDELERRTYDAFPQSEAAYLRDLDAQSRVYQTLAIGSYITYPNLGMCEIVGYNHPESNWGTYQLKVLKTGQIVNHVRIGDNRIQRQG